MTKTQQQSIWMDNKHINILISSVQLHAAKPRKPVLMGKAVERSLHTGKNHNFFGERFRPLNKNGKAQQCIKIANLEPLQKLARQTGKQIRILLPKGGIPVYFAKDALEVTANKKRNQRKL